MASELFKLVGTISISTENAVQNINAVITEGENLEKVLKNLGTNAESSIGEKSGFNTASVWLGNMLTELSHKAVDLGIDFAKIGFAFNASAENYKATFKSMLGLTDEETDALFEKLRAFAVETPYSMGGVAESAIRLFNAGFNVDGVMNMLEVLGNIAGGDSQKLGRLIKAFTDTKGYGFLRAQERNQFVENGVLIYDLLSDYYEYIGEGKKTAEEIATMQSDKAISYEDVWNALLLSTQEGFRYYERMDALMATWGGKTEKLSDNLDETAGAITMPFFDVIKNETIDKLSEVLDRVQAWAEENPEVLNNLATALSDLATNGLDALLGGLERLLAFWNSNQDLFNGMLMLLGGIAIKSGKFGAGAALITAGGYNVWDDWVKENQKAFSGLTSDVDLPFIKQQLEYQGQGAQWEAYLENWKSARKGEGYSDEEISNFIDNQFANYKSLTNEELRELTDSGSTGDEGLSWWRLLNPRWDDGLITNWFLNKDKNIDTNADGVASGGLNWWQGQSFGNRSFEDDDFGGSTTSIQGLIASVQGLTAAVQSMTGSIPDAISSGIGGITVTGTVTTGNVTLDSGAIVGQLAPKFDLKLGGLNRLAGRTG